MNVVRGVTAGAGVTAVLFGLLLLATPPLTVGLDTSEAVVSALGVVVAVAGVGALVRRYSSGTRRTSASDASNRRPVAATDHAADPGAAFDRQLRSRSAAARDRLEATAVDVLTTLRNLDPETAREQLRSGDWTKDRAAAAFFAPAVVDRTLRRPTWLGGEPAVVGQARAVVDELSRITHEETRDDHHGQELADPPSGTGAGPTPEAPNEEPDPAVVAALPDGPTSTGRWTGVGALTLVTVGIAVFTRRPGLLVPAAIGVGMVAYAAYGRAGTPREVSLLVERSLSTDDPDRGDPVRVTVTVRNEGDRVLPDVRLADGVPEALAVTNGEPGTVTTLRPDESTRFTYTVTAEYGDHEFDTPVAILRDATGERQRRVEPTARGETLTCRPRLADPPGVPLRAETTGHVGPVAADDGGSGLAFHAVRDHRPGDPLSLIDWKRFARTGDLATIEFQQERRTDVVLAVDGREAAAVAPDTSTRNARHRAIEAADVLATALLDAGCRVGISAVSAAPAWLGPGTGTDHQARLRGLLATDPAFTTSGEAPFVRSTYLARLRRRLPSGTQVVLCSPLADGTPVELARELEACGVPVTVLSPDPTGTATTGGRLASVERRTRMATLRHQGVPVIDWTPDTPLPLALARTRDLPVVVS
jgi:uncharacterized protein (DUF58 family)